MQLRAKWFSAENNRFNSLHNIIIVFYCSYNDEMLICNESNGYPSAQFSMQLSAPCLTI